MTFEEFFTKKKIDLAMLQRAKPDLYEEFRQHYAQMGEKSFDHTKKYWFNRLRKDYLLEGEATIPAGIPAPKPMASSAATTAKDPAAPVAEAAKPTGLSSMSPSGFKPRFKAAAAKSTPDSETPAEAASPPAKPVGFKPRFKAGVTTPEKAQPTSPPDEPAPEAKPLGFKPRFKAGTTSAPKPIESSAEASEPTKPEEEDTAPTPENKAATPPTKPTGFKPRFKPGVTGANKGKSD
jgi:hypothetical protein